MTTSTRIILALALASGIMVATPPAGALQVDCSAATGITRTAAWMCGNVVSTNGTTNATLLRLYYGTSDGGSNAAAWSVTNGAISGVSTGVVSTNITSLTPAQLYYYRWHLTEGTDTTWAAASTSFWSLAGAPTGTAATAGAWPIMVDSNGLIVAPSNFWTIQTGAMAEAGIALDIDLDDATQRLAYIEALTGGWESVRFWWGDNTNGIAYVLSRTDLWDQVVIGLNTETGRAIQAELALSNAVWASFGSAGLTNQPNTWTEEQRLTTLSTRYREVVTGWFPAEESDYQTPLTWSYYDITTGTLDGVAGAYIVSNDEEGTTNNALIELLGDDTVSRIRWRYWLSADNENTNFLAWNTIVEFQTIVDFPVVADSAWHSYTSPAITNGASGMMIHYDGLDSAIGSTNGFYLDGVDIWRTVTNDYWVTIPNAATNIAILVPGGTNWLVYTNGSLMGVAEASP